MLQPPLLRPGPALVLADGNGQAMPAPLGVVVHKYPSSTLQNQRFETGAWIRHVDILCERPCHAVIMRFTCHHSLRRRAVIAEVGHEGAVSPARDRRLYIAGTD